ncbi:MAG: hypothetical protein KAJ42_10300 [Gemmatimonadetes bacterium]|nr:hypothetical protein [Gemmatimonadota bacterium]
MKYELKKPCKTCPFVIAHKFPLRPDRIEEIRDCRATFSCHNTVDYDAEEDVYDEEGVGNPYRSTKGEQHCFGFLVVCWADWGGFDQMQAMAARAGMFKPEELPTPEEAGVFATWADMIDANEDS